MNASYYVGAWTWGNPNELYHHGIMGQRWGKRNGPPYPLAPGDHSVSEVKAKDKNAVKLDSWKDKEIRKINKYYENKIAKAGNKLAKAEARGNSKKEESARKKLDTLKAKQKAEKSSVMSMNLSDVKAERAEIGKNIVKQTLKYGVATSAKMASIQGIKVGIALGNVPILALSAGVYVVSDVKQLKILAKGARGLLTGARRSKKEFRENKLPKIRDKRARRDFLSADKDTARKYNTDSAYRDEFIKRAKGIKRSKNSGIIAQAKAMRKRGMTYYEIADKLQIADGTVYAMINEKDL